MATSIEREARQAVRRAAERAARGPGFDACFHGMTFRVHSTVPAVRRQIEERFTPYYGVSERSPAPPDYTVVALQTDVLKRFDALLQDGASLEIQPHPTIARYHRRGVAIDLDEIRIVRQYPSDSYCAADPMRRTAVVTCDDPVTLGQDVRRLLRDLLAATLLVRGHQELHASGVALGDAGVAFAGESNSGKTTLLFDVLRTGRAALMCNGRLFIEESEGGVTATGVPEHFLVRLGTLAGLPEFRPRHPRELTEAMSEGRSPWTLDQTAKISLQLAEVLSTYRARVMTRAPLRVLVFANLQAVGDPVVRDLSPAAVRETVPSVVADEDGCRRRFWHGLVQPDWDAFARQRERIVHRMLDTLRFIEIRRSPDGASVVDRHLLDRLRQAGIGP